MENMQPARTRNIIVFVTGVLVLGNLFGFLFHVADGLGGLAFILSPIALAVGLRTFAGDGWGDAGFRPNLRSNLGVYAFAVLLFPLSMAGPTALGTLSGNVTFQPGAGAALIAAMAVTLPSIFAFAFFEEVGWRGYLEPRLAAMGVPGLRRHLFVALVWGPWHVGYILSHPQDYGHLPLPLLFLLTLVAIAAMSVIYGATRSVTASLWPAVIAHTMGNMLAWPLTDATYVAVETPLVFAARPDSLLVLTTLLMVAVFALRWEKRRLRTPATG